MNRTNDSPEGLAAHLASLREARLARKAMLGGRRRRRALAPAQRALVLAKTGGRCHICGGEVDAAWQADHVLAHAGGGSETEENYLPAHALCNNYRWDYSAEEFQYILKLGVWARTQIERQTAMGRSIAKGFTAYERVRLRRRKGSA